VKRAIVIVVVVGLLVGIWALMREARAPKVEQPVQNPAGIIVTETATGARRPPNQSPQLIGEVILRDYAKPNLPPQNDLTLMSHLMENSLLLLKSAANRPLSANEDWADFLKGQNAARERFLPDRARLPAKSPG